MKRLVILASGSGSNAENLIAYFKKAGTAEVACIFCNRSEAGVFERAKRLNIPAVHFTKNQWETGDAIDAAIASYHPDLIILAGFLLLFPKRLLEAYPNRVINIHPALLPKYGGKGMYGNHVHKAVLENKESIHGVTVHLVNEKYDEGRILAQQSFVLSEHETLENVLSQIHAIEFELYPKAVEQYLLELD